MFHFMFHFDLTNLRGKQLIALRVNNLKQCHMHVSLHN